MAPLAVERDREKGAEGVRPDQSLVSVVMPVFNGETYLAQSIASVLSQRGVAIELVVVDDASTDGTASILEDLSRRDWRLRVLRHDHNRGVQQARAAGLHASSGDRIAFADADDFMPAGALALLQEKLDATGGDIAVGSVRYFFNGTRPGPFKQRFRSGGTFSRSLLHRFCRLGFGSGSLWGKLYRRRILSEGVAWDLAEVMPMNEDYVVNLGAFSNAGKVCLVRECVYLWRQHSESTTARWERTEAFARLIRAYVVSLEVYRENPRVDVSDVDELYRRQLRFPCYRLRAGDDLRPWDSHIAESLNRLAAVHPAGIYTLARAWAPDAREGAGSGRYGAGLVRHAGAFLVRWGLRLADADL